MMNLTTRLRNILPAILEKVPVSHQLIETLSSLVGINIFLAGLSFVTTIMVANTLGREQFGDLAFAIALGTYGLMFIQYGLEKSLVRELVHFPKRFGELLKATILLRSTLFVLFIIFLVIAFGFFNHNLGLSWGMVPVILAMVIPGFQLQGVYDAWQEMRRHAVFLMIDRCTYFTLVWAAVLLPFLTLSIGLVGAFMMAGVFAGLFLQYYWAFPRIDFQPVQGSYSATAFIVRSNFWIWLAVLSGLSIDYMSQIILKWYAGSAELGMYNVAWKTTQFALLFLAQAGRIGAEATARHTRPEATAHERIRFLLKYSVLMTAIGFMAGLPFLIAPQYILKLFRPEYANAAETMRLFGIYPIIFGPYLAVLQYIISSRMQIVYFTLITTVGVLSITLSYLLIPRMQGIGAVISVICSLGIALILFVAAVVIHLKGLLKSSEENLRR
jgi:O-antigen/teichoic acid export membrane protein